MFKLFLGAGSLFGTLAVALGAMGAHALEKVTTEKNIATFHTGVTYQMYHALALILVALLAGRLADNWLNWAGYCFIGGILFFSGSIYGIVGLRIAEKPVPMPVGIATPIGGLLFIAGWICLFLAVVRK